MGRCRKIYYRNCCDSCSCNDYYYCNTNTINSYNPCNVVIRPVTGIINPLTLTTIDATSLTFNNVNYPTNNNGITIAGNTIILRDLGTYIFSGYFTINNTSGVTDTITITPTATSGLPIIIPTNNVFTNIPSGTVFNGSFNFTIQVTSINTQLNILISSNNVPVNLTSGQINIIRTV